MDPRPVISIHGNVNLFRNSIQSSLQEKLRAKRPQDLESKGLSSYCADVDFQLFDNFAKEQLTRLPFYREPCLHSYWTDCSDVDQYRNRVRTEALSWVRYVEEHRSCKEVEWVVVHVTQENGSKGKASTSVLEKMRSDFDSKGGGSLPRVISLKTSPGTPSKSASETWNAVTERVYSAAVDGFRSLLTKHQTHTTSRQNKVEEFQTAFLDDVDLAVGLELINEPGKALTLYHELCTRLSSSLNEVARKKEVFPHWCTHLMEAPCHSWHCPCLDSSSESWKFLPALHSWAASLLEVKLFLYARMIFTLFALRRVWQAETICSEVLHSTAREMKRFKPNCPPSAFDCWAYAIARMTVLEIMLHLTADVVGSAYVSNSPLLIRVRLWSYAFEKLDAVGRECGLMPGTSAEPPKTDLLEKLLKGLEGQPRTVEEETQLVKALQSKESFSEVYVDMGRRVIGALKHAGRRRAAFSVAKDVAMFLRDEGRLEEVVELLTDICKYYSGEGWVELSEGVYTILASSFKELGRTEDYLHTVVKLISLYSWGLDHSTAIEKATPWMEELESLSQLPREELDLQSRLKWRPLFELVQLQRPSSAGDHCVVNSSVECTLCLKYHGPKDLSVSAISVALQRDQDSPLNASQKVGNDLGQQLSVQDYPLDGEEEEVEDTDEGQLSLSKQYGSLESLDLLDEGPPLQPLTDALSGSDEYLANLALETALPQTVPALQPANSICSLDHLGGGDADGEFFLSAGAMLLKPGENTVKLAGLARSPGKFDMYKAVISIGNLSFSTGVPADSQAKTSVSVLDTENKISVSISPASSVVLAGLSQRCLLKLSVGQDTCIPKDALLRISSPTGIMFVTPPKLRPTGRLSPSFPRQQLDQPHPNCTVFLPAVEAGRSFTTPIHILAPSLITSGANKMAEESESQAWTHQIAVQCDWLVPVHTAAIPVTVFEPLSYCVKEVSAGDRVLVQLVMENSCPLPLLLRSPQLDTTLNMMQLNETPPQALLPGQDFSFLWQVHRDASEKVKQEQNCTFSVQWRAAYKSQELRKASEFHKSEHLFTVYSTATEYRVRTEVRTNRGLELKANCNALLHFVVRRCFNSDVAQSLSYKVELDKRFWELLNQENGELYFPKLISEANMTFEVCPTQSGELPLPYLSLSKIKKSDHGQDAKVHTPIMVYSANKAEFVHVS